MIVISARNVNEALLLGLMYLHEYGTDRDSRNGPVKVFSTPVVTEYERPLERVLFFAERDANPFFHFFEALWMLAGRRDVAFVSQFSSNIANYSDDGRIFHGAYGHRWRNHFQIAQWDEADKNVNIKSLDQLATIAHLLKQNPDDRRIVLQMWDAVSDLGNDGKDYPCNIAATFRICPYGRLDMTVFNRSNDMIWGAYGANAVHFSMLQEMMAAWVGVPVGKYWQISTNFHAYKNILEKLDDANIMSHSPGYDPYSLSEVAPFPMVNTNVETWMSDLAMFMSEGPVIGFQDKFFKNVVAPMWSSWQQWKTKEPGYIDRALADIDRCLAPDWHRACREWLLRRANR